ncbi:MAG: hypothetical protein QOG82_1094, partial [Actinomycetota bacterium]|nr:hypothetical protein [Actinomycetota bacterium]
MPSGERARRAWWAGTILLLGAAGVAGTLLSGTARAATSVPGATISTDTTWNLAGSPYVVSGDVTVSAAATLSIDPGVVVQFDGDFGIEVAPGATLASNGTAGQPVSITAFDPATSWNTIQVSGTVSFTHTQVSWGGNSPAAAAVDCQGCVLRADHLRVDHS